jgi:hypothetical protein
VTHTRKETNIMFIDAPSGIVLSAGTYQGTDGYAPVHPSQKAPITSNGPPTAAVYRRSSGGGKPRHSLIRTLYLLVWNKQSAMLPIDVPIPTPRKRSPF